MKRFCKIRGARVVLTATLLVAFSGALAAQTGPTTTQTGARVSARAGQRSPVALPAPEQDGIHLSLDQAIRAAIANNQDMEVTVNTAEAAQFFLFQNTGIYDPLLSASATRASSLLPASTQLSGATDVSRAETVDASAQVSQLTPWGGTYSLGIVGNRTRSNSTFSFVNPSLSVGLSLGISQPLLRNFGKRATNIRIDTARNSRDAQYQNFVRSVQTTIDFVEQAYWDLVYARANLLVKQEARNIAVELNRITKIKIDVGSLAPIDIVQTEVGVATADQDIINAEAAVGVAGDQLRRLLNFEATSGQTPIIPTDEIRSETQAFDLAGGLKVALQRRPEILAQSYVVASDVLSYEYWQNQTLPQLDLVANYGRNGLGGRFLSFSDDTPPVATVIDNTNFFDASRQIFDENFRRWSVGFVFSYPLFNRAARGAKGVAEFTLQTERSRLTVLQQDVIVGVRNAHRAIVTASRQIVAASKGRELAERNLDAARKKYDNGMTTSFEVSQIQAQLSDAKSKELNALAIYRKAVSAYHSAIADILDWKGVQIEGIPESSSPRVDAKADAELLRRAVEHALAAP
ncbi:MAG: TolC family protein [Acidobacteriota bacterium]